MSLQTDIALEQFINEVQEEITLMKQSRYESLGGDCFIMGLERAVIIAQGMITIDSNEKQKG